VGWSDLVELVRAPAALSVPGDVVAGAAASGNLSARTPALAGASVCLYWGGMAANDWADREIDAKERPERPIPSGRISPGTAFAVAAGLTAAGVAIAALAGGRRALAVAAPLAGAVWAYDLKLKHTAAGPAAMAACRGLDVLLGAACAGRPGRLRRALWPAAVVAAHTYTVTALSRAEVDGAEPALPRATLAGTAAVAAAAAPGSLVSSVLAALYGRSYGRPQRDAIADPSASKIRAAVGAGIMSLPSLQGALTAQAGAPVTGAAVAAAAPLGRRLIRKVSPT
jgi:4-hydroxybenzoate polyprenyltransferase